MSPAPRPAPGPHDGPGARDARRLSRDRHGRGRRGPLAWPPVPEMLTRQEAFDQLVLDAVERLLPRAQGRLDDVEVAVELLPGGEALVAAERDGAIPLGHVRPASGRTRARLVVYRRPVESRAATRADLEDLVDMVVVEQAAALLMVPPEELDPGYDPGEE